MQKMDWKEAQAKIKKRYETTEVIPFDFGDGSVVEFEVRGLKPAEYEGFERKVSKVAEQKQIDAKKYRNINFRKEPKDDDEDTIVSMAKQYFIKHGLVGAPDGFEPTQEQIDELPPVIKATLADTIDELTNLGIETKEGFR